MFVAPLCELIRPHQCTNETDKNGPNIATPKNWVRDAQVPKWYPRAQNMPILAMLIFVIWGRIWVENFDFGDLGLFWVVILVISVIWARSDCLFL